MVHERHRGAVVAPLSRARIDEIFDYRKVLELGALRMAPARGADLTPVLTEVERLEALAERTPSWRQLMETRGAIDQAIVAAGNDHLLESNRRCEDEVRLLLAFVRPDFDAAGLAAINRRLVTKLGLGGEAATDAVTEDIDHPGRAALLTALHRAEDSAHRLGR